MPDLLAVGEELSAKRALMPEMTKSRGMPQMIRNASMIVMP